MPIILDGTNGVTAAAVTTTTWSPTNVNTPGYAVLGDSSSDYVTINAGNTTFAASGARILGDFSNATAANRLLFQTSTTNGSTSIGVIPNGTSTNAEIRLCGNSDPTNTTALVLSNVGTEVTIRAGGNGTYSYAPMTFYTGGSERIRIDTAGTVIVGAQSYPSSGTGTREFHIITSTDTNTPFNTGKVNLGFQNLQNTSGTYSGILNFDSQGHGNAYISFINVDQNYAGAITFGTSQTGAVGYGEKVRIDSSGNLLVGATSGYRTGKLVIKAANLSQTSTTANVHISTTDAQGIDIGGSLGLGGQVGGDETPFGYISGRKENSTSGNYAGYLAFATQSSGASVAERMRIDSAGNVGIGITAPVYTLNVKSPSGEYRTALFESASLLGPSVQIKGSRIYELRSTNTSATEGAGLFFIYDKTAESSRLTVDSSGNIGIGTTSPAVKLDVAGSIRSSGTGMFFTQGSSNYTSLSTNAFVIGATAKNTSGSGGTGTISIISNDPSASSLQGNIALITDATATNRRLSIGCIEQGTAWRNVTLAETAGNVGIGTANPGYKLDVLGSAQFYTAAGHTNVVAATSGTSYHPVFQLNNVVGDWDIGLIGANQFSIRDRAASFAQRLIVDAAGGVTVGKSLGVGGATATTSGYGITFPASQNASTDPNTLDDYEEGTWTPTDVSAAPTPGLNNNTGYYVKIGKLVYASARFFYNTNTSAQQALIGGLPFSTGGGGFSVGYTGYNTCGTPTNFRTLSATGFYITNANTGASVTCQTLSGQEIQMTFIYTAA